jgi:hypothetical protein
VAGVLTIVVAGAALVISLQQTDKDRQEVLRIGLGKVQQFAGDLQAQAKGITMKLLSRQGLLEVL